MMKTIALYTTMKDVDVCLDVEIDHGDGTFRVVAMSADGDLYGTLPRTLQETIARFVSGQLAEGPEDPMDVVKRAAERELHYPPRQRP